MADTTNDLGALAVPHSKGEHRQSAVPSNGAGNAAVGTEFGVPPAAGPGTTARPSVYDSNGAPLFGVDDPLSGLNARERRMAQRRCIAEDPEWNLALVERLSDLCIKVIVANFEKSPQLNGIPEKYRERVLDSISVDLPLHVTAPLIPDEQYWQRRAKAKFKICDQRKHGNSWKQLFFELHVQQLVESFVPKKVGGLDELQELQAFLKMTTPFIKSLDVRQMKPMEPAEGEIVKATDPPPDHVDISVITSELTNLKYLKIYYGLLDIGMKFEWRFFGMTMNDCTNLCQALKATMTLQTLILQRANIDDDRVRLIASSLLENKTLEHLDLSHNKIGDSGARGLAKLLATPTTVLRILDLGNNRIARTGAHALGSALIQNMTLQKLVLRMNLLGDEGGVGLLAGVIKAVSRTKPAAPASITTTASGQPQQQPVASSSAAEVPTSMLSYLDLSSTGLGPDSVAALCVFLKKNATTLCGLDLSCNKFAGTPVAAPTVAAGARTEAEKTEADTVGKLIFDAICHNKYITYFDLRATDISQEHVLAIKGLVTENSSNSPK